MPESVEIWGWPLGQNSASRNRQLNTTTGTLTVVDKNPANFWSFENDDRCAKRSPSPRLAGTCSLLTALLRAYCRSCGVHTDECLDIRCQLIPDASSESSPSHC
jgi:hypothetical protein